MKISFFGILLFCSILSYLFASPVSQYGALKQQGSKIIGTNGEEVQVAGPSLYWSIWGGEEFYNSGVIGMVATDWNATLTRAAIAVQYPDGYIKNPEQQLTYAKSAIDAAIENDIYILVDWHDHNANLHIPEAKEFFGHMAKVYKNTPNIIWEIWNEPDNKNGTGTNGYDTWDDIRSYADSIIPVIREHSSNLIVVGTPNWSSDPATAAANPLSDPNVAYTLHFYAGTHGETVRKNAETAMTKDVALFITEFGTTDASGGQTDPTLYLDETKTWLDWADFNGISWANWSLAAIDEPCSELNPDASPAGNWTDEDLSESGRWIRDRLLARPASRTTDSALILTVAQGSGTVTLSPEATRVKKGTEVTFTALPSDGWTFASWSNASTSTDNPVTLTIDGNSSLVATFKPAAGSSMLSNGDFFGDEEWFLWVDTATGNDAVSSATDSQLTVSITSTDTLNWGIQLSQGDLTLENGATYTIMLDAWSTDDRTIYVGLSTAETWHFQGGAQCNLTSEKTTHTITIIPDSTTDQGIFQINFGGSLLPVYVDNIQMVKTAEANVITPRMARNSMARFRYSNDRITWTPIAKNTTASLLNLSGRVVVPATASNPMVVTRVPPGLYLLVVSDGIQKQAFQVLR